MSGVIVKVLTDRDMAAILSRLDEVSESHNETITDFGLMDRFSGCLEKMSYLANLASRMPSFLCLRSN